MATTLRLLLIEDCETDAALLRAILTAGGYDVRAERIETAEGLRAALDRQPWDLVISDHSMPQFSGTAALRILRERTPDLPFIFVSGTLGEDVAVTAMKNGAQDYILKGNLKRLVPAVDRELRDAAVRRDRKRAEERLAYLAYHDALTNLPNRLLFDDRLRQSVLLAKRDRQPLTLLVLDLDGFKVINDTLGHHVGDCVLQQIASRIRGALRESDTVARLGGDEFAVLLPCTDIDGAMLVARKALKDLKRPVPVEGHQLNVRASIGISRYEPEATAENLLQKADIAMYAAKADGAEVAIYSPNQDAHAPKGLALTTDIRRALEHDEFFLEYQPIVRLQNGTTVGVEALVRWNHPRHGRLLPGDFVPLAERAGLIDPLTGVVLDKALTDWGPHCDGSFTIAVNLSPRSLNNPELPDLIARALQRRRIQPSTLTLEITESAVMADQMLARRCLSRLHNMGVRIAVDDFGTGYSWLSYLRRLPLDELKIDRSFVGDLAATADQAIVRSTIDLGHSLGLAVVAEGVESKGAHDRLVRLGCDSAQGMFIGAPAPIDDIRPRIARQIIPISTGRLPNPGLSSMANPTL